MNELHNVILEVLKGHAGKENRIGRRFLRSRISMKITGRATGLRINPTDREMRQAIKDLREEGHLICSSSGSGGYWMAADYGEAMDIEIDYRKRALSCLMTASKIRKSARKYFSGQLEMQI